ncbi:MAG: hypothetical protein V3W41_11120 [Planctomycetota bacterium]
MTAKGRRKALHDHIRAHTALIEASVQGNAIDLKTRMVRRLVVGLPFDTFDEKKPILIKINGRQKSKRLFQPQIKTYLNSLARCGDPWLAIPDEIRISN